MLCETGSLLNRKPIQCKYYSFTRFIKDDKTENVAFCNSLIDIASIFNDYSICDLTNKNITRCSDYEPIKKERKTKSKVKQTEKENKKK